MTINLHGIPVFTKEMTDSDKQLITCPDCRFAFSSTEQQDGIYICPACTVDDMQALVHQAKTIARQLQNDTSAAHTANLLELNKLLDKAYHRSRKPKLSTN